MYYVSSCATFSKPKPLSCLLGNKIECFVCLHLLLYLQRIAAVWSCHEWPKAPTTKVKQSHPLLGQIPNPRKLKLMFLCKFKDAATVKVQNQRSWSISTQGQRNTQALGCRWQKQQAPQTALRWHLGCLTWGGAGGGWGRTRKKQGLTHKYA